MRFAFADLKFYIKGICAVVSFLFLSINFKIRLFPIGILIIETQLEFFALKILNVDTRQEINILIGSRNSIISTVDIIIFLNPDTILAEIINLIRQQRLRDRIKLRIIRFYILQIEFMLVTVASRTASSSHKSFEMVHFISAAIHHAPQRGCLIAERIHLRGQMTHQVSERIDL